MYYSDICSHHIVAYSESCLFWHIFTYPGIFNNESCNNINFFFFTLILHTFQQNLKTPNLFDNNDVNLNAQPSLFKNT